MLQVHKIALAVKGFVFISNKGELCSVCVCACVRAYVCSVCLRVHVFMHMYLFTYTCIYR